MSARKDGLTIGELAPGPQKPVAYIGIDPGQAGAVAAVAAGYGNFLVDWPGDEVQAAKEIRQLKDVFDIRLAVLEKVGAMPKQGVSSTFKFGANFGVWRGILAALEIPFELKTPQAWQKGLVKKSDGKDPKERSLTVARRLFPHADLSRKKDHGRADALLMAEVARRISE